MRHNCCLYALSHYLYQCAMASTLVRYGFKQLLFRQIINYCGRVYKGLWLCQASDFVICHRDGRQSCLAELGRRRIDVKKPPAAPVNADAKFVVRLTKIRSPDPNDLPSLKHP